MLSRDIANLISSFLDDDDTSRKNLLMVNRQFHLLFANDLLLKNKLIALIAHHRHSDVERILQLNSKLLDDKKFMQTLLFHYVMFGQLKWAEEILQKRPELLFMNGTARDYSYRTFKESNPIRYCLWTKDSIMLAMLLYYLIPLEGGLNYAKQQFEEHKKYGVTYIKKKKGQPEIVIENEQYFDFNPLLNALEHYKKNWSKWEYKQASDYWRAEVVPLQEEIVSHLAQHYCEGEYTFNYTPTFERRFARSLNIHNYAKKEMGVWFPLVNSSILHSQLAKGEVMPVESGTHLRIVVLKQLWETRDKDIECLEKNLYDPMKHPLPDHLNHQLSFIVEKKGWSCSLI